MPERNRRNSLRRGNPAAQSHGPERDALGLRREPRERPAPQPQEQDHASIGDAFRLGTAQVRSAIPATGAAVAGSLGFEDTARRWTDRVEEIQQQAADTAGRMTQFTDLRDEETGEIQWGDAPRFAGQTLAQQAPNLAFQAAGGILGGGLARQGLRRMGRRRPTDPAGAGEAGGAVAGGATAGGAMMASDVVPRVMGEEAMEHGDQSITERSRLALGASVAGGAAQAIPMASVVNRLGVNRQVAGRATQRSLASRIGRGVAGQTVAEVPVDIGQAMISRAAQGAVNDNIDLFDDDGLAEMINAAAASAVTAAPTGAASAVGGRSRERRARGEIGRRMEARRQQRDERELRRAATRRRAQKMPQVQPERTDEFQALTEQGLDNPEVQQRFADAELSYARDVDARPRLRYSKDFGDRAVRLRDLLQEDRDELQSAFAALQSERQQAEEQGGDLAEIDQASREMESSLARLDRAIEGIRESRSRQDASGVLNSIADAVLNEDADLSEAMLAELQSVMEPHGAQISDLLRMRQEERGESPRSMGRDIQAALEETQTRIDDDLDATEMHYGEAVEPFAGSVEATDPRPPQYVTDPIRTPEGEQDAGAPDRVALDRPKLWQTEGASRAIHGEHVSDSLLGDDTAGGAEMMRERMQARYPNEDFEIVPYSQAVRREAIEQHGHRDERAIRDFMEERALEIVRERRSDERRSVADLYGVGRGPDFLDNFVAIERRAIPRQVAQGRETGVTEDGVALTVTDDDAFLTPSEVRRVVQRGTRAQRVEGAEPPRGSIPATFRPGRGDAEEGRINLMDLAQTMAGRLPFAPTQENFGTERVADLVFQGLSSLAQHPEGADVRWSQIPDDTVVFTQGEGDTRRDFTWGEISRHGAARWEARADQLRARLEQLRQQPQPNERAIAELGRELQHAQEQARRTRRTDLGDVQRSIQRDHEIAGNPHEYSAEEVDAAQRRLDEQTDQFIAQQEQRLDEDLGAEPGEQFQPEQSATAVGRRQEFVEQRLRELQQERSRLDPRNNPDDAAKVASLQEQITALERDLARTTLRPAATTRHVERRGVIMQRRRDQGHRGVTTRADRVEADLPPEAGQPDSGFDQAVAAGTQFARIGDERSAIAPETGQQPAVTVSEIRQRSGDRIMTESGALAARVGAAERATRRIEKARNRNHAAHIFEQQFGHRPTAKTKEDIAAMAERIRARAADQLRRRSMDDRITRMRQILRNHNERYAREQFELFFNQALPEGTSVGQIHAMLDEGVTPVPGASARQGQEAPARRLTREERQGIASTWAQRLGLTTQIEVVSAERAAERFGDDAMRRIHSGRVRAVTTPTRDGRVTMYVNPEMSDAVQVEALAHEVGHLVYREQVANLSEADARKMMNAFHKWRASMEREAATVGDAMRSKKALASLTERMSEHVAGKRIKDMGETERQYLLDFEEWFADHTSRWLTQTKAPQGVVARFFKQVADQLKALLAQAKGRGYRADRNVAGFLRAQWDGSRRDLDREAQRREASNQAERESPTPKRIRRQVEQEDTTVEPEAVTALIQAAVNHGEQAYRPENYQDMKAVFDNYLTAEEKRVLGQAFTAPGVRRQLRGLVSDPAHMASIDNGNARLAVAVGYQFWLNGKRHGGLKLGPQTRTPFVRIRELLERVFGYVSEDTRAAQVLANLTQRNVDQRANGYIADPTPVQVWRRRNALEKTAADAAQLTAAITRPLQFILPASTRVRLRDNPVLEGVVQAFNPTSGVEGRGQSMFEARIQRMGEFNNAFNRITEELTQAQGEQLLASLQDDNVQVADPAVARARDQVRKQLRTMRNYAVNRGLELGDSGADYFPWVFDKETLMNNRQQFINLVSQEKYAEFTGRTPEERLAAAERIYDAIQNHDGYADSQQNPTDGGHTPHMASAHQRTLAWLHELGDAQDQEQLAQFFSKDIGQTLATYTEQIVKRSEFAARFGTDGAGLEAMFAQAAQLGATERDIQLARNYVSAMMGTLGRELHPALRTITTAVGRVFGKDWSNVDPQRFRQIQGAMIVYQNIRVLGLATMTSVADTAGIITRADSPEVAFQAFKHGLKEVVLGVQARTTGRGRPRSEYRSELRRLAESLGTIDMHMVNEVLGESFAGNHLTGMQRRINEKFFRAIQLQRWTRFSRMMGLAAGRAYLMRLRDPTGAYARHYERFMDQLGLSPGDIQVDEAGQLEVLSQDRIEQLQGQRERAIEQGDTLGQQQVEREIARDARIRTALNRFVDQSVMRPNPSQRPIWASHPDAALFFHLKQFAYAIQTQIVNRTVREAGQGNWYPMAAIMSYVPIMVASDLLRELLQHGGDGDPRKEHWSMGDYLRDGIHRSGMLGLGTFALDVNKDRTQFGGIGYESLTGPTATQAEQLGSALLSGGERGGSVVRDALPANNVWKYWDIGEFDGASWGEQTGAVSGWRY